MITIQRIFWGHMLAAVAFLSIGYAWVGWGLTSILFVFLGLMWFTSEQRNAPGLDSIILFIFLLAAALGILQGLPGWSMLLAVVATLVAWDLAHFLHRLKLAERVDYQTGLGREHLRRLILVEGVGFLAGLLALTLRAHISFWWEALLAFLAIIGVGRLIAHIRKQTGG